MIKVSCVEYVPQILASEEKDSGIETMREAPGQANSLRRSTGWRMRMMLVEKGGGKTRHSGSQDLGIRDLEDG